MKKLLLVGAFVLAMSAVSFGQGRMQRTPDQQVEQLKTQVTGITDDQATKIKAIYTVSAKSMDSLRTANAGGDMRAMFTKMQPINDAANAKIKTVLTASQVAEFQKAIDARAERMKQMMQNQ